jgi:hypothetical protein
MWQSLYGGKSVITTDEQVRRLMKLFEEGKGLTIAASKSGMTDKTARKYLRGGLLPSQRKENRDWRTRLDPFDEVWREAEKLLEEAPGLETLTVFGELQRRHPGRFQDGQLRTLQRRVRIWRGLHGPEAEVIFPQIYLPGGQSQSDFTNMNAMEITIAGLNFPHLLYHFVLCYSNWEYLEVCASESFEALSRGIQNALEALGKVPEEHRTDNLSAASYQSGGRREYTPAYRGLMQHYAMRCSRNQPGEAHQNGDVEQSHYRIKELVDQTLLLRGSRNFRDRWEYEDFLRELWTRRNRGRTKRLQEEWMVMRSLPGRRLEDYREFKARVSPWSTIQVAHNTYSAPSRLIRYEVLIRLYAERVEIHFAGQCVATTERLRGEGKARINYRHVIGSLVRKPGAFERYRYREEMFPSTVFRQAYDELWRQDPRHASRRYLEILQWAAHNSESGMETALREALDGSQGLEGKLLMERATQPVEIPLEIDIPLPCLKAYDRLLGEPAPMAGHWETGSGEGVRQ